MSTTVFKGSVQPGTISVTLRPDAANPDSDLLLVGYSPDGGHTVTLQQAAAPGGFATLSLDAASIGSLEVMVATGFDEETGHLEVSRNGVVEDADQIEGSTRWIYAVVP